jgi:hypothetical protein
MSALGVRYEKDDDRSSVHCRTYSESAHARNGWRQPVEQHPSPAATVEKRPNA